jgi:hypothetical protein
MLTRTRTTIITLMASASIGMPAVLPTVSHAQPPEGGAHAATCEAYRLATELWEQARKQAEAEGKYDLASYYEKKAIGTRTLAQIESCIWSSRSVRGPVHAPIAKVPGSNAPAVSATAVVPGKASAVTKLPGKTKPPTLTAVREQIAEAAEQFSTAGS